MPGSDGYFDEQVAATYDDDGPMFDAAVVTRTIDFLAKLAGRYARVRNRHWPDRSTLAEPGVRVHGIELSSAMTARLRARPGGDEIGVTIGDFSTATVAGSFSLVYLVCNTIENLTTQAAQVACFRNASAHLEPGGLFVIEVEVPQLRRLPPGDSLRVFSASGDLGRVPNSARSPHPSLT